LGSFFSALLMALFVSDFFSYEAIASAVSQNMPAHAEPCFYSSFEGEDQLFPSFPQRSSASFRKRLFLPGFQKVPTSLDVVRPCPFSSLSSWRAAAIAHNLPSSPSLRLSPYRLVSTHLKRSLVVRPPALPSIYFHGRRLIFSSPPPLSYFLGFCRPVIR